MQMDKPPVVPYLTVKGGKAALEFYQKAFGAEILFQQAMEDGRILHASLNINGGLIMLSDEFPEHCATNKQPGDSGTVSVTIHLNVDDVDAAFQRAVDAGAKVTMPVEDQFWGDRYGRLKDPFGHEWSLSTPSKNPPQGMQQPAQASV